MMNADEATDFFESYRGLLTGLAYRMLGSVSEAEDVVQDTYLRWREADHGSIRTPRAWLVTACSRLAIDELRSARVRREHYPGPWLPEPWVDESETPAEQAEVDDSVSMALLVVLEKVSPTERAAFLLHDIFDFKFDEVADILGKTSAACRKLASRARERVREGTVNAIVSAQEHTRFADAFIRAAREGDHDGLINLLHPNVTLHSDGGGKAQAAMKIVEGLQPVGKFFRGVYTQAYRRATQISVTAARFNGYPGLLIFEDGKLVTAFSFALQDGAIRSIFAVRNPDKLERLINSAW